MATLITGWLRSLLQLVVPQLHYQPLSFVSFLRAGGLIRGASPIFPELPTDEAERAEYLQGLSDDELNALLELGQRVADELAEGNEAALEGMTDDESIAELERGVEVMGTLRAEREQRDEQAAENAARRSELLGQIRGPEDEAEGGEPAAEAGEDDGEGGEEEGDEGGEPVPAGEPTAAAEPEPVAAAAAPARRRATPPPVPASRRRQPVSHSSRGNGAFTAASEGVGFALGHRFRTDAEVDQALAQKIAGTSRVSDGQWTIARFQADFPDDFSLDKDSEARNEAKIRRVRDRLREAGADIERRDALVAAGGLCAPPTPYYDLMTLSQDDRPVRDALPRFGATRGGIVFKSPLTLASITTAITRITAANDAAGGTSATKGLQTITCPSTTEVDVAAIASQIKLGEFNNRTYPEQIAQFRQLVGAAWARTAEVALLDGMKAASKSLTGPPIVDGSANALGVRATLLGQIATAAYAYRNRHRMEQTTPLRVMLPEWVVGAFQVDHLRRGFGDNSVPTQAEIEAEMRAVGVLVSWYEDSATGDTQIMGGPGTTGGGATGNLIGYPAAVKWLLFSEGTFLFLDGGTLDLGIIRDSTLVATNDLIIFMESFENVAMVGVESLYVSSAICANGLQAGTVIPACPVV